MTPVEDLAGMVTRAAAVIEQIQASHPRTMRLMAEIVEVTGSPSDLLVEELSRRRVAFDEAWATAAAAGRGETSLTAALQSVLEDVKRGWLA